MKQLIKQITCWRERTHQLFLLVQFRPIMSTIYTLRFPKAKSISIKRNLREKYRETHCGTTASNKATAELPSPTSARLLQLLAVSGSPPSQPGWIKQQARCLQGSPRHTEIPGGFTRAASILKSPHASVLSCKCLTNRGWNVMQRGRWL